MNEEQEAMIDEIIEKKEFTETLRKWKFDATADEYIEMCGALKLYITQLLEEERNKVASECLDLICGYCNGDGISIEEGEEGKPVQVQCSYCRATGIDYNKFNMLKQKYIKE